MQRASFFLPTAVALALLPWVSAAARPAWNADRVTELASNLIEQTQGLEADLRASAAAAEAAADDPDRAVGVGTLTLVIRDGRVEHVFYPVFPPDAHAEAVLDWAGRNPL